MDTHQRRDGGSERCSHGALCARYMVNRAGAEWCPSPVLALSPVPGWPVGLGGANRNAVMLGPGRELKKPGALDRCRESCSSFSTCSAVFPFQSILTTAGRPGSGREVGRRAPASAWGAGEPCSARREGAGWGPGQQTPAFSTVALLTIAGALALAGVVEPLPGLVDAAWAPSPRSCPSQLPVPAPLAVLRTSLTVAPASPRDKPKCLSVLRGPVCPGRPHSPPPSAPGFPSCSARRRFHLCPSSPAWP